MDKKWVFDALVASDKDHEGLIAYALYKHDKAQKARKHRNENLSEDAIETRIQEFHDIVVENVEFQKQYKARALLFLVSISKQSQEEILKAKDKEILALQRKYESEISELRAEHKKERSNYDKHWVKQVKQTIITEQTILKRFLAEAKSSALTAAFTVVFSGLVVAGVLMWKTTDEQKRTYLRETAEDVIDIVIPKTTAENTSEQN